MEELQRTLETLPISALAKVAGGDLAHRREDLINNLLYGTELPSSPMMEVRRRIHAHLACRWDQYQGLMDPVCEQCHLGGQTSCHDMRAVGDYILNLTSLKEKSYDK